MSLLERYNRDGYVVVRDLFCGTRNSDLIDSIRSAYDEGIDKYIGFLSMQAKTIEMYCLFANDSVIDILVDLGVNYPVPPTTPVLNVIGLNIPNGYNGTSAHQDWPSIQGSKDMITVWVPLTDTKNNYPLEVIPGSHTNGLYSGESDGNVLAIKDIDGFVPVDCNLGDAVFMSGFLVHRTGEKGNLRVAASMRFDNADNEEWQSRNYYCAQKRVVDREIKHVD